MDGAVPAGEGVLWSGGGVLPRVWACLGFCVGGEVAQIQGTVPVNGQRLDPLGEAEHCQSQVVARPP